MEKQRLDKIIASTGKWSRREVRELARMGQVLVDGVSIRSAEEKVNPEAVSITVNGEVLCYRRYTWIMLNSRQAASPPQRMEEAGLCWICCPKTFSGRIYFPWAGWTRIRKACCC